MRKIFTFTLSILISTIMFAQIVNPSLDNWAGTPEEPVSWATPNKLLSQLVMSVPFPVVKSTDAVDGSLSALLETREYTVFFTNKIIVPGVISTGQLGLDNNYNPTFSKGTPYTFRPDSITAMYKYFPVADDTTGLNDTFQAFLLLTKWNAAAGKADTIGIGSFKKGDSVTNWTKMVMMVNYLSTATPDTLMLVFSSSSFYTPQIGTQAFVDNIQDGNSVGIISLPANPLKVNVYPNPASNYINVDLSGAKGIYNFTLFDILGKRVDYVQLERSENYINISQHKKGMYFYDLKDQSGRTVKTGKINIVK